MAFGFGVIQNLRNNDGGYLLQRRLQNENNNTNSGNNANNRNVIPSAMQVVSALTTNATNMANSAANTISNATTDIRAKVAEVGAQKEEKTEQVKVYENAARATQIGGVVLGIAGAVALSVYDPYAGIGMLIGGLTLYHAAYNGERVCENLQEILNNPLQYKTLGKWNTEAVRTQLQKNTQFFDFAINALIEQEFSNTKK